MIIQNANIAKGTFYHYFKSKKDVLDAVIDCIGIEMLALIEKIALATDISPIEKLKLIFTGADKQLLSNANIMQSIHEVENRALQEQLNIVYIEKIIPLITEVFNQGYERKLWGKKVSDETMQIILGGTQFVLDSGLFRWNETKRRQFIGEIKSMLESAIEAKPNTLLFIYERSDDEKLNNIN